MALTKSHTCPALTSRTPDKVLPRHPPRKAAPTPTEVVLAVAETAQGLTTPTRPARPPRRALPTITEAPAEEEFARPEQYAFPAVCVGGDVFDDPFVDAAPAPAPTGMGFSLRSPPSFSGLRR